MPTAEERPTEPTTAPPEAETTEPARSGLVALGRPAGDDGSDLDSNGDIADEFGHTAVDRRIITGG